MTAPLPPGTVRRTNIPLYIDRRADDDTAMRTRFAPFGDDANLAPASQFRADHDADMRDPEYRQAYETQAAELAQAAVADNAGEACDTRHPGDCGPDCPGYVDEVCPRCGGDHSWCQTVQDDEYGPAAAPGVQADDGRRWPIAAEDRATWLGIARQADVGRTEELRAVVGGHLMQAGALASFAEELERAGELRAAEMADRLATFYRQWASDPAVIPTAPEPVAAATTGRGDDGAVQRVLGAADELDRKAAYYQHAAAGSHDHGLRTGWLSAATDIRAAVAGDQDTET